MSISKSWSQTARGDTKERLEQKTFGFSSEGIAFKHIDGAYGIMSAADAATGNWMITDCKNGRTIHFGSVDDPIADGWVLD